MATETMASSNVSTAEVKELIERSDEYLGTIANKGDCGPHHLVSDMAAALRGILGDRGATL